ncbi:hypothetical protein [Microbulbifer sp. SSSA005]|uniref:hypothetical protein n=1 Tax=Microbulbifer sp. SSSA005 TaxID=3243378 RepID=UPI0040397F0E
MAHPQYTALGRNPTQRGEGYRALFKHHLDGPMVEQIRKSVNKGLALGNARFKEQLEQQFTRRVTEVSLGRPRLED